MKIRLDVISLECIYKHFPCLYWKKCNSEGELIHFLHVDFSDIVCVTTESCYCMVTQREEDRKKPTVSESVCVPKGKHNLFSASRSGKAGDLLLLTLSLA